MPARNRLLVVDDDADIRAALVRRLRRRGYSVHVAEDGRAALDSIQRERYDLILLDQMMPGMTGVEVLRSIRASYSQSELPIIMVTGVHESETVVEALELGANDYVVKPVDILVVAARIQSQLNRSRSDREIRATDALTGLSNRARLLEKIAAACCRQLPDGQGKVAALFLDLDGFKAINDGFGHAAGDRVLEAVGRRLKVALDESGISAGSSTLARIGGDEFVVLLDHVCGAGHATRLADLILTRVASPIFVANLRILISGSIGIAFATHCGMAPEELLHDAGLAMHGAKELGKNRWHVFESGLRDKVRDRVTLSLDLRHAVERGELRCVYQPEIHLATRAIVSFECLLRWHHPSRGWLTPAEFISLSEETDLIIPIGKWVLDRACWKLKEWQTRFPKATPLNMNVNLSVKQLADSALVDFVQSVLAETGIAVGTLRLELTESVLMTEVESCRKSLARLQSLNVGLKLDDFGTGYSSLSYLRRLHFDSLKIDRSFVSRLVDDPQTRTIVEMIIRLAHELDMSVVAEGIEDARQLGELTRMGCDTGQGNYFAPPLKEEEAAKLLEVPGCLGAPR